MRYKKLQCPLHTAIFSSALPIPPPWSSHLEVRNNISFSKIVFDLRAVPRLLQALIDSFQIVLPPNSDLRFPFANRLPAFSTLPPERSSCNLHNSSCQFPCQTVPSFETRPHRRRSSTDVRKRISFFFVDCNCQVCARTCAWRTRQQARKGKHRPTTQGDPTETGKPSDGQTNDEVRTHFHLLFDHYLSGTKLQSASVGVSPLKCGPPALSAERLNGVKP